MAETAPDILTSQGSYNVTIAVTSTKTLTGQFYLVLIFRGRLNVPKLLTNKNKNINILEQVAFGLHLSDVDHMSLRQPWTGLDLNFSHMS